MEWLTKMFGWGRRPAAAPAARPTPGGPTVYEELIALLVVSPELQAAVRAAVARAFAEPQSFYDAQGKYTLAMRGLYLTRHLALTPKFVFLDTLQAHNLMAEVDWKADEEEIRQEVRAIMQAKHLAPVIEAAGQYGDQPAHEVLYLLDHEELGPGGYSLQTLDINSDSYVFTIVRRAEAARVQELFGQL